MIFAITHTHTCSDTTGLGTVVGNGLSDGEVSHFIHFPYGWRPNSKKKNDRNCWVWSLEIGFHVFSTECTVRQNHASPPNSMDDIKMIVISHTGLIVDNTVPPRFWYVHITSKFTVCLFSIYGLTITWLRVKPTLTHYSDIVSDISSGNK